MRKDGNIISYSARELFFRPIGRAEAARIKAITDEQIARAVSDDPSAVPLDFDWSKAKIFRPSSKMLVSIRIDPDVLAFFKAKGKGYQTRINAVLRSYMDHERKS